MDDEISPLEKHATFIATFEQLRNKEITRPMGVPLNFVVVLCDVVEYARVQERENARLLERLASYMKKAR